MTTTSLTSVFADVDAATASCDVDAYADADVAAVGQRPRLLLERLDKKCHLMDVVDDVVVRDDVGGRRRRRRRMWRKRTSTRMLRW